MSTSLKSKRIVMSLLGVFVCAVSVGGFKHAQMGVDPFQSLMSGIDALVPISFGTLYVIVNAVLLLFSLVFDRKKIGLATFINLFLLGYITQFSLSLLQHLMPHPTDAARYVMFVISVVIMCIGSSLYITADLGVSTYDAVALVISEKRKNIQFRFCRIGTDLVCVMTGTVLYLLSGKTWQEVPQIVGLGTLITAFMMGPLVSFFNDTVARPLLYGKNK